MIFAVLIGIHLSGKKILIPIALNSRWANATAIADSIPNVIAARNAVIVVPTSAPSV